MWRHNSLRWEKKIKKLKNASGGLVYWALGLLFGQNSRSHSHSSRIGVGWQSIWVTLVHTQNGYLPAWRQHSHTRIFFRTQNRIVRKHRRSVNGREEGWTTRSHHILRESRSAAQTCVYRVLRVFMCGFGNLQTVMEKWAVCHLFWIQFFSTGAAPVTVLCSARDSNALHPYITACRLIKIWRRTRDSIGPSCQKVIKLKFWTSPSLTEATVTGKENIFLIFFFLDPYIQAYSRRCKLLCKRDISRLPIQKSNIFTLC